MALISEHNADYAAPPSGLAEAGLLDDLDRAFVRWSDRAALRREARRDATDAIELTYRALDERSRQVAARLRAIGLGRGSVIALWCESRPEWAVALIGAWRAGATVVPVDTKLTTDEIGTLLAHAAPAAIVSSRAHLESTRRVAARLPSVQVVASVDAGSGGDAVELLGGPAATASTPRGADEVAVIVYTSGTTGDAKGVQITFGNLAFQRRAVDEVIGPQGRERFLSVLPLNHLYELICGLLVPLGRGACVSYAASESLLPADLKRTMKERKITSLVGVPLLYRALERGIRAELRLRGALARAWFAATWALAAVVPSAALRRRLFAPVLAAFGGGLRCLYSGGAPLDPEVEAFFLRLGLPICQGYGLSETSPVIATNAPAVRRDRSVGRPLPGVEVRIVPLAGAPAAPSGEGEIWTRGPHVMRGYLRRDDLTAETIDADGWLHTGDLGRLDADGFLHVTGRSKDLIVLGGGKKVHPDEVEAVLAQSPLFSELCVLGVPSARAATLGHDEVCAVVVPAEPIASLPDAKLQAQVEIELDRLAAGIAGFKRPTRVVVRREPIPRTATRKAKRRALHAWITETPAHEVAA